MAKQGVRLSRRTFVTSAAAAGVGAALSTASVGCAKKHPHTVSHQAEKSVEESTHFTYHQEHCGGTCPLACTVRDGRLVLIQPNHAVHDRYETICLKGISEIQNIYGDHRVQTPLKRVGERGEAKFVPISWEEALDTVVDTITDIQKKHGEESVLVTLCSESNMPLLPALFKAQTGYSGIDIGYGNGLDPAIGYGGGYAMATCEARDWTNSKLVLNIGNNFLETSLPHTRLWFEAKDAGCRMVTIDPHFSTTAGKSHQWVPIKPGTDPAFWLGMITHVLDKDLIDHEFVKAHTSLPFLVDTSDNTLVRLNAKVEIDEDGKKRPQNGEENPYVIWDSASDKPVSYLTEGADPVLEGGFVYEGRTYKTVFTLLKEHHQLEGYTTAWASQITDIPEETIISLVEEYAQGPACISTGWGGNDKMANADIAGHAVAILTALTGNISKKGAGVGNFIGGHWNGHAAALGAWPLPEEYTAKPLEMQIFEMRDKPNSVRAAIFNGDIIQQRLGNMKKSTEWAKKLDFIVSIDPYFTEGAKWSDIILPVTTRFENDSEVGNAKVTYNNLALQNKVIDPLFEAKTEFWVQKELANRLGAGEFMPKDAREYVEHQLSGSPDLYISKLTIEEINSHNGIVPLAGIEEPRREFMDHKYNTSSKRMDVYYEDLVEFNQQLPTFEYPLEITDDNPLREKYPLQFSSIRTRYRIHNQYNNAAWIKELVTPTVDLNPVEMESRGLKTGDLVTIFNDRGSIQVYAKKNDSIRPGCARMFEGITADYLPAGNVQELTNDEWVERGNKLMVGPVIPFFDTLVEIKKV